MLVHTQLLQHLSALDEVDLPTFKAYLKNNTSTRQQGLIKLLNQLAPFHPAYRITEAVEQHILRKLIPGVRYDKATKKLNRWCNELLAHLEGYLIKSLLDQEEDQKQQLLRAVYLRQGAFDLYQKNLSNQLKKMTIARNIVGKEEIQYQEKKAQLSSPQLDNLQHALPTLGETINHLEQQFAWQRIRLELDELNQNSMFAKREASEQQFTALAWNYLEQSLTSEHPMLKCYLLVKKALEADSKDHLPFELAKDFFLRHATLLSHQDSNVLIRQLLNIGNRKLKAGRLNYLEDVLALYQFGLQHQLFLQQAYLPVRLYINIATISGAAGAFAWAENFINTHKNELAPTFQELGHQLAMAGLCFQRGSTLRSLPMLYAAQNYLPDQHQLPVWYSLRRYSLDIRIHYEIFQLNEADPDELEWSILRFSKYLQRKEIIHQDTIELYKNGVALIRMMLQFTLQAVPDSSAVTTDQLRQQLEQAIPWKQWLSAKVQELTQS